MRITRRVSFTFRGPRNTEFTIGDRPRGKDEPNADPRISLFLEAFPTARRVLEIGWSESGFKHSAADEDEVAALESRTKSLMRAQQTQGFLDLQNVTWVYAEVGVEVGDLAGFGHFDAVLCSSVLHHLAEPSRLLDQLPKLAAGTLIRTHVGGTDDVEHDGFTGEWFDESPRAFRPSLDSLLARLNRDWSRVDVVEREDDFLNGPTVTIACRNA